jgi:hypothetical protein
MGVPHGAAHTRNSRRNLICAILRDYVSASGYSVIEAADGADSIAKVARNAPISCSRIQLPVLDPGSYDATSRSKRCRSALGDHTWLSRRPLVRSIGSGFWVWFRATMLTR